MDEEYFEVLSHNEELFITDHESISSQILSRMENFLAEYIESNFQNLDSQLKDILQLESFGEMLRALSVLNYDLSSCLKSSVKDDIQWFKGNIYIYIY